jgi:uncharacterized membrane protein
MPLLPAILFYDVVLALHIAAIVVAFGVTFAYPILDIYVTREHPRVLPVIHGAQERIGRFLIAPAGGIALLAGFYLASDRDYMSKVWVVVPMIILIGLLALGGAFFGPSERKASELAARDVAASAPDGPVTFSPEYKAVASRIAKVGGLANVLILVAIFFMTAKPGGY